MKYFKKPSGKIYAGNYTEPQEVGDIEISMEEVSDLNKKNQKRQERESKIIASLGAKDKQDAIIKQLNLINEAIASGNNAEVKKVDEFVKQILSS